MPVLLQRFHQLTTANLKNEIATYMLYTHSMSSVAKKELCVDVLSGLGPISHRQMAIPGIRYHVPLNEHLNTIPTVLLGDSRLDLRVS